MLVALLQTVTETPPPTTWAGFVREGLTLLIQALGAALLALLTFVAKSGWAYLREKKKIEVSADVTKRVEDAITKGVAQAQEWGMKTFVPDPANPEQRVVPTGAMKQQLALETAVKLEPAVGQLQPDVQAALLDAKLQLLRKDLSLPPPARPLEAVQGTDGSTAFTDPELTRLYNPSGGRP
jgi:hypothetical protein